MSDPIAKFVRGDWTLVVYPNGSWLCTPGMKPRKLTKAEAKEFTDDPKTFEQRTSTKTPAEELAWKVRRL